MPKIFISYRREESQDITGRMYDRLTNAFGKSSVFKDVNSIPIGIDFRDALVEAVNNCDVLLAVIGTRWLESRDQAGRPRLSSTSDFVRIEIEAALKRDIPVIPLLVNGAAVPRAEDLPASLRDLSFRNGTPVRFDPDFHNDMDRLITGLSRTKGRKPVQIPAGEGIPEPPTKRGLRTRAIVGSLVAVPIVAIGAWVIFGNHQAQPRFDPNMPNAPIGPPRVNHFPLTQGILGPEPGMPDSPPSSGKQFRRRMGA